MELKLVLPVPTSINKLYINEYGYQYNPKTKKKEKMPTGRRILSQEGRKTKARIQAEARMQLLKQADKWDYEWTKEGYVYQDTDIVFSRRGSDDNNVYKLLNDSLEGIIYDNDSRVLVRTQKIVYDPKNPHIVVRLKPVGFIGIFDDEHSRDEFQARCEFGESNGCSKYRNGRCSILQDSLNGTVREEVGDYNNPFCNSFKAKK